MSGALERLAELVHTCTYDCVLEACAINDADRDVVAQILASDWLAAHDAEVAEDAWDEGYDAGHQDARAVNADWPEPTANHYRVDREGRG